MKIFKEAVFLIWISTISLSTSQFPYSCAYYQSPLHLEATVESKYINLPNNGDYRYKPNQRCEWIISTDMKDYVIRFTIVNMKMEGKDVRGECLTDYIDIFDMSSNGARIFKARVCSDESDEITFISTESSMTVQFNSNHRFEYRGFEATYDIVKKEDEENKNLLTISLVVSGSVLAIIIICALIRYVWKKMQKERSRRSTNTPVNDTTARFQRNTSPAPDSSFLVYSERSAARVPVPVLPRPPTPPPAYDSVDHFEPNLDGFETHLDGYETPPPSYDTVLKTSNNTALS